MDHPQLSSHGTAPKLPPYHPARDRPAGGASAPPPKPSPPETTLVVTRTANGFLVRAAPRGDFFGHDESRVFETAAGLGLFLRNWGVDHEVASGGR